MKFRETVNGDGPAIRDLVFGVLREFGFTPDPAGTDADLSDPHQSYVVSGGTFQVLEDEEGRIMGTVGLMPRREGVCELRKMYLLREARGQGLGKALLARAVAEARRLGFRRMELETESRLTAAIQLYQRFGFRPLEGWRSCGRCDQALFIDLG